MKPAHARFRAFRFHHPDAGCGTRGLAIEKSGTAMIDGPQSVRQSLALLLSTRPGERVMRPSYGCRLHELAFSPNDDTTAGLAMHYVGQAVEHFETRVAIESLDAGPHPNYPDALLVRLRYRILESGTADELALAVDLGGEGAA